MDDGAVAGATNTPSTSADDGMSRAAGWNVEDAGRVGWTLLAGGTALRFGDWPTLWVCYLGSYLIGLWGWVRLRDLVRDARAGLATAREDDDVDEDEKWAP